MPKDKKDKNESESFDHVRGEYLRYRDLFFKGIRDQMNKIFKEQIVREDDCYIPQKDILIKFKQTPLEIVDPEVLIEQFCIITKAVFIKSGSLNRQGASSDIKNSFYGVKFAEDAEPEKKKKGKKDKKDDKKKKSDAKKHEELESEKEESEQEEQSERGEEKKPEKKHKKHKKVEESESEEQDD